MLEPEYFNDKADKMLEIYRQLEDFILQDIARRLLKLQSVSGTADRMMWKLQQMGESRTEIMEKLSRITSLSRRELQILLQDAVMTSWIDDLSTFNKMGIEPINPLENANVRAVMDVEYKKSQGELENLTRTTMNQSMDDLIRMLDEVEIRVASGMQSYSSAVCEILDNYARKGVTVEYPVGTKRTLEAAVRMCVVTSMNQTSAQITNQYIVEGKVEYVLVSAHLGARIQQPSQPYLAGHENWQGKVYKIRGSEPGFPNLLEMTGYDIENDGKGKVVNPLGLHGYNCRHSHKAWDKELKNPYIDEDGKLKIDTEKSRRLYKNQQRQRARERAIRKTKRELLIKQEEIGKIAETDVREIMQSDYDRLAYRLRKQNAAYDDFCKKNDLQTESDRLKVAGFKREQAAKARGRARAYENWKIKNENNIVPQKNVISKVLNAKKISSYKEIANTINVELDGICINKSKWSGEIHISDELLGAGQKEWDCSISLIPNAEYADVMHELIHARSVSYYDEDVYRKYYNFEEGVTELLTEQLCKIKEVGYVPTYENQVKHLLRINRRGKIFVDDYEFAKTLINIPLPDRPTWLIRRVNENYRTGMISGNEYDGIMESLSKLLEEYNL